MFSSKPSNSVPNSGDDKEIGGGPEPRSKFNSKELVEFPKTNDYVSMKINHNK